MYISDLKIHGFKSFAKKEDLRFGEGITAVVGPNGCGKTNIVDAIRWVLGEQKYSVLRSNKMEEVIFNGSKGMKPMGVCEVSLTVHNNKGRLPIEYSDVEVSRRVYRNGESEYFLNRNPCRLKDIFDLFVDTGMGADSYSVIELKMIEQILSESGNDRFRMFEEAAGINKYKIQRKHSLRKFEIVKQDLSRVDDIISEVEEKVRHLNLQLKRFKRYEKLQENLKDFEISLGYIQLKALDKEAEPLSLIIKKTAQQRESKTTQEDINERELKRSQTLYKDQSREVEEIQKKWNGLKNEIISANQQNLIWNEQSHSTRNQIDRLNSERKTNANRTDKFKKDLVESKDRVNEVIPEISLCVENHKSKKEEFDSLNVSYKEIQKEVELLQGKRWKTQTEKSEALQQHQKTNLLIEEKSRLKEELKTELVQLSDSLSSLSLEIKESENNLSNLNEKKSKDNSVLEKHQTELQKLDADLDLVNKSILEIQGESKSLTSQIKFYQSIISSNEGFPDGTRYILEEKSKFPEVLGVLVDLLKVDKKYSTAVSSVLGEMCSCLVVKNRKSVFSIVKKLKEKNLGNVSFIPLDGIQNSENNKSSVPKDSAILGKISDFVNCSKELSKLKYHLFDKCLLCTDLDSLKHSTLDSWNCVDLKGQISARGIIKFQDLESSPVQLGRRDRLKVLEKLITKLSEKEYSLSDKKYQIEKNISDLEVKLSEEKNVFRDLRENISHTEGDIRQKKYQKERTEDRISYQNSKLNELRELITQLKKSRIVTKQKVDKIEKEVEKTSNKLNLSEEKLAEIRVSRDSMYEEVQALHLDVVKLENKREQYFMQAQTAEKAIEELEIRDTIIATETSEMTQKINNLEEDIQIGDKTINRLEGQISGLKTKLDLQIQVKETIYQEIEDLQTKIRTEQKSRESLLEDMKESEQKLMENEQRKLVILNRLKDLYEVNIPEYLDVDIDELELQEKIQKTHRSIENIGAVNLAVQSDYNEEMDRLNVLQSQRTDLVKSEQNLRETIQNIDEIAREIFLTTFDQINLNFSKLFTLFFEGGEGKLELIGDPDPLEADIAIRAQPPGKRNQNLRMLSAGEKSLTAIALLFAIYQFKPSPYCILDEVDAPLDDVNIRKFTRVLQQFSDETQFIVVTHNKLTMEAANYLYGVTMEQKGVSKLVSVKFEA
tara:strand:- start:18194 stop:21712 length:3519 start_codon:yes stop_codon:yes gene_type:complete